MRPRRSFIAALTLLSACGGTPGPSPAAAGMESAGATPLPPPTVYEPSAAPSAVEALPVDPPPTTTAEPTPDPDPSNLPVIVCTDAECIAQVAFRFRLPMSFKTIAASSVTLCRNEECLTTPLTWDPVAPDFGRSTRPVIGSETERPMLVSSLRRDVDGFIAFVTWAPRGFPIELEDGDRFELTVTDSKGRKVLSARRTATYQEHYPNGKRCDVYPCKRAEFDIE